MKKLTLSGPFAAAMGGVKPPRGKGRVHLIGATKQTPPKRTFPKSTPKPQRAVSSLQPHIRKRLLDLSVSLDIGCISPVDRGWLADGIRARLTGKAKTLDAALNLTKRGPPLSTWDDNKDKLLMMAESFLGTKENVFVFDWNAIRERHYSETGEELKPEGERVMREQWARHLADVFAHLINNRSANPADGKAGA